MVAIRKDWPPNIDTIRAVLPVTEGNIFAYRQVIYNPSGAALSLELIAHEMVHFRQQGDDPDAWWRRFLLDPDFRLEQELEAHREEYRVFCVNNKDRNARSRYAYMLGGRLSAPMYGGLVTAIQAIKLIVAK